MRILSLSLSAAFASAFALSCQAADFDGSKPFLCSTIDVASCVPGQDCARESAQTVSAPEFFTIDVGKKLVSEVGANGTPRISKIDRVDHQSGLLLLEGTDGAQAWAASVGESNGKVSYSVVGDRVVVVAFGACLNR